MRKLACTVTLAAMIHACASLSPTPQGAARPEPVSGVCVPVEQLADWQPIDESRLLLWAPHESRAHLLVMAQPITGLPGADDLEVIDGDLDGRICGGGRDGVFVDDSPQGSAAIVSIEYLSAQRTAELRGLATMSLSPDGRP